MPHIQGSLLLGSLEAGASPRRAAQSTLQTEEIERYKLLSNNGLGVSSEVDGIE